MARELTDYTDDWLKYWEIKYETRSMSRMKSAAQHPATSSLGFDVTELDPSDDDYEYQIRFEDLIEYPDSVLDDARQGFRSFVEESDIEGAQTENLDIIPIHVHGLSKVNPGRALVSSFDQLSRKQNELAYYTASILNVQDEFEKKPASIGYTCPAGHETRVKFPMYSQPSISICPEDSCENSAIPVSRGTTALQVAHFEVEFDNTPLNCIAYGTHSSQRHFESLKESDGRLQLTGILRKTVSDGEIIPLFECLYLSDSIR